MPIIKSAVKRVRTSNKRRSYNVAVKSVVRKKTKFAVSQIETKAQAKAQTALLEAISAIDKAAKSGVLHKNTAARKKSQLTKAYNSIAKQAFGTGAAKIAVKKPVAKTATKPAAKTASKSVVKLKTSAKKSTK